VDLLLGVTTGAEDATGINLDEAGIDDRLRKRPLSEVDPEDVRPGALGYELLREGRTDVVPDGGTDFGPQAALVAIVGDAGGTDGDGAAAEVSGELGGESLLDRDALNDRCGKEVEGDDAPVRLRARETRRVEEGARVALSHPPDVDKALIVNGQPRHPGEGAGGVGVTGASDLLCSDQVEHDGAVPRLVDEVGDPALDDHLLRREDRHFFELDRRGGQLDVDRRGRLRLDNDVVDGSRGVVGVDHREGVRTRRQIGGETALVVGGRLEVDTPKNDRRPGDDLPRVEGDDGSGECPEGARRIQLRPILGGDLLLEFPSLLHDGVFRGGDDHLRRLRLPDGNVNDRDGPALLLKDEAVRPRSMCKVNESVGVRTVYRSLRLDGHPFEGQPGRREHVELNLSPV
jgi:hypothetical protein